MLNLSGIIRIAIGLIDISCRIICCLYPNVRSRHDYRSLFLGFLSGIIAGDDSWRHALSYHGPDRFQSAADMCIEMTF